MRRARRHIVLLGIVLVGAWLRLHALAHDGRLHPDEALFSTFARRAALNGDWLLPGALDKPPLAIYASAVAMLPFIEWRADGLPDLSLRGGETATRLPATFASIVTIPLMFVIARRLSGGDRAALTAALLLAISPFAVAFSAVAFTDGLMFFWLMASLWCVTTRRWAWAGVCMALGFASKQQALFWVPLILMLGWGKQHIHWRHLAAFIVPLMVGGALLHLWDGTRTQPTSLFALAFAHNDPARLIRSEEIVPRISTWVEYALAFAAPITVVSGVLALSVAGWRILREVNQPSTLIDSLLLVYTISYLFLHWLVAFNTYDRYLLPVLPPALLLMARGIDGLWRWWRLRLPSAELEFASFVCVVFMAISAREAAQGQMSIGADQGEHTGIEQVADYLNALPLGTIIYDHWFGWELDYYLGQWTDKRRVYYPTPGSLAEGALMQPDPAERYLVVPVGQGYGPWLEALSNASFAPTEVFRDERFAIYRLTPPQSQEDARRPVRSVS